MYFSKWVCIISYPEPLEQPLTIGNKIVCINSVHCRYTQVHVTCVLGSSIVAPILLT